LTKQPPPGCLNTFTKLKGRISCLKCYATAIRILGAPTRLPAPGFGRDVRWPGVVQKALGAVIMSFEEGLGGRTTVWEDPIEGHKNGKEYLIPCLATHSPLDLVIIMLGTNDLKVPVFRHRSGYCCRRRVLG